MSTTSSSKTCAQINPIDYGKIKSIMDQANTINDEKAQDQAVYNKIFQNFYNTINNPTITGIQNKTPINPENEQITTFTTSTIQIPKINILDLAVNTIKFSINALPTLVVLSIVTYFLISIKFNINQIQTFPQWLKHQTETFAKENIIPHLTNGNKEYK